MFAFKTKNPTPPQLIQTVPYMALPARYIQDKEMPQAALKRIYQRLCDQGLYSDADRKWKRSHVEGASDEQNITALLNKIVVASSDPPDTRHLWCHHESKLVQRSRKPGIILVSKQDATLDRNAFSSILSYCEVKATKDSNNMQNVRQQQNHAIKQLFDLAGRVLSAQKGRRFFVGLSICNSRLILVQCIRGCTLLTAEIDIDSNPELFIHIILTVTDASPTWMGFDPHFNRAANTLEISGHVFDIVRTLFSSLGMQGRGTAVYLCKCRSKSFQDIPIYCALKRSWVSSRGPNDTEVYKRMEKEKPEVLSGENEALFGPADAHGVFRDCLPVLDPLASWDYEHNLPGLPIVWHTEVPIVDNPLYGEEQADGRYKEHQCEDTTANIVARIGAQLSYEARTLTSTAFRTIGVPIHMFSCRRELLNGMMGAVTGLFNALRKKTLHCDVSPSNVLLRVPYVDVECAIPEWPPQGYTKRPGFMTDLGLALRFPPEPLSDGVHCGVTGTLPYIAVELLASEEGINGRIAHQPHHDLESLFWVLWFTTVNYIGPFGKRRTWVAANGQTTAGSSLRPNTSGHSSKSARASQSRSLHADNIPPPYPLQVADPSTPSIPTTPPLPDVANGHAATPAHVETSNIFSTPSTPGFTRQAQDNPTIGVPVWATHEVSHCSFADVYQWKRAALASPYLLSEVVSPYFAEGPAGRTFLKGIEELAKHFQWTFDEDRKWQPPKPITHAAFLKILAKMRDAFDDTDKPSQPDIERAKKGFEKMAATQEADFEAVLKAKQPPGADEEDLPFRKGSKRAIHHTDLRRNTSSASKRSRLQG